MNRKTHWENVFETKDTAKVSWYQRVPETSIKLIEKLNLPKSAKIIEVGSGDSYLGDSLLELGFSKITLLDISEKALKIVEDRLKNKNSFVKFIATDVTDFSPYDRFDIWHDRAVFHFLVEKSDIQKYVKIVAESVVTEGFLIISTFSNNGPDMCSGLKVKQYSETKMTEVFSEYFNKIECFTENHLTPSGGSQNFLFCVFQRK